MKTQNLIGACLCLFAVPVLTGCTPGDSGTSGGPGVASPSTEANETLLSPQAVGTFSIEVPMMSTAVTRGGSDTFAVSVVRGETMNQNVAISFGNLPAGVTIEPSTLTLAGAESEASFTLKASADAAAGDHSVTVTGKPQTGAVATATLKITVDEA